MSPWNHVLPAPVTPPSFTVPLSCELCGEVLFHPPQELYPLQLKKKKKICAVNYYAAERDTKIIINKVFYKQF